MLGTCARWIGGTGPGEDALVAAGFVADEQGAAEGPARIRAKAVPTRRRIRERMGGTSQERNGGGAGRKGGAGLRHRGRDGRARPGAAPRGAAPGLRRSAASGDRRRDQSQPCEAFSFLSVESRLAQLFGAIFWVAPAWFELK